MSKDLPLAVRLEDYRPPGYLIDHTDLEFHLEADQTRVRSRLDMRRNPDPDAPDGPLVLDGDPSLDLQKILLDGQVLNIERYSLGGEQLIVRDVPEQFEIEIEVVIDPSANTALEGLYLSNGMFCTQCEAQGFRRITYYLDRPDVMSRFRTRVIADAEKYPVLLSNGNPIDQGEEGNGRHWASWDDPFPKPAYLFALVAGDLQCQVDHFRTLSGREVELRIYVEARNADRCDHALDSLKKSMSWDEEVYGREYDLDIFMIVAVDHFNMGAMENKGLNIFNSSCVLAKPETTTDVGFDRIQGIVAHEYFHNWSGNRVTCRDWFQLSLKEGFTVFRDSSFTADMGSATVKRIEDVSLLRTSQFAEDSGPMAHPVRPASYIEISNFYTLTVYEKGAELVGMIHRLLGPEMFRKGSDLYFERHDGQAVTTDDFVTAMEEASGVDLTQFKRWYEQAGTPVVEVTDDYDESTQTYRLNMRQSCPPTPECRDKKPFLIPITTGLLDKAGNDLLKGPDGSQLLQLAEPEQTFEFAGITERPVPSLLRGFSAPVRLRYDYSREQLALLMRRDSDGFNRWDAGQKLALLQLDALRAQRSVGSALQLDPVLRDAFAHLLAETGLDKAMLAKMLALPSEAYLTELADIVDVEAIHATREFVVRSLACDLYQNWRDTYEGCKSDEAYGFDAEAVARRSLKNRSLDYLVAADTDEAYDLARHQLLNSNNMTEEMAALTALAHSERPEAKSEALELFYNRWQGDALVINQWLMVQATDPRLDNLKQVKSLLKHPAFDFKNPNKIRSLIGAFGMQNPLAFHHPDGSGYVFLADQVIELDSLNPQIASRLLTPLTRWRKYPDERAQRMKQQLERIADGDLSKDVYEIVNKSLVDKT